MLQAATGPYLAGVPQVGSTGFSPYFSPPAAGPIMPLTVGPDPTAPLSMVQQTVVTQQKMPRSDRLEVPPPSPYAQPFFYPQSPNNNSPYHHHPTTHYYFY
jgi:hypothetical protein